MALLLADIGGTHARFTFLTSKKLGKMYQLECNEFKNPLSLIQKMISFSDKKINGILLAVAGPVQKGFVQWTNRPKWSLSESELKKIFQIKNFHFYNDVYAQGIGLSLSKNKKALLMNVGTGFGSCILYNQMIIPCEFGLVLDKNNFKKEKYLSGSGIVRLYHELGGDKKIKSAKKIDELRLKKDKIAQKSYEQFYTLWGQTAANIATGLMLSDGIYLWGGLVPKNKKDFEIFKKPFFNSGYPKFTKEIPCFIVKEEALTIKGLKHLSEV